MARPFGSTTGRVPDGGFPAVPADFGAFMAGFIEGEASFLITKQPRNTNHRCVMSLRVRDDDAPLLSKFAEATAVGAITAVPAHRTSNPQASWMVSAKADCVRLAEILTDYPLRGRKSKDFALWSSAVHWWVDGDPTKYHHSRDWAPMIYLRNRLKDVKRYGEPEQVDITWWGDLNHPDWTPYLSGFIAADGTIGINRSNHVIAPALQIQIRRDDEPLLDAIRRVTGVGKVYRPAAREHWSPASIWRVVARDELSSITSRLDSYPPLGRTGAEYEIWREAVAAYASGSRPRVIRPKLEKLRAQLDQVRRYGIHEP